MEIVLKPRLHNPITPEDLDALDEILAEANFDVSGTAYEMPDIYQAITDVRIQQSIINSRLDMLHL